MEIKFLKANNFQSFRGEVYYEIQNGVPVLVKGDNQTDPGQESNGAGKSVLMSIVEYVYLHMTSKKVNDVMLINWLEDDCELSSEIYCPIRKESLLIERGISRKGGGRSQLSVNGKVKYSFDDKMVNEIDKFIIDWIGVSKEDLQNFFILSKFKYVSFFAASNTNLVSLIGRFSNSNIISGIDSDILSNVTSLENNLKLLNGQKDRVLGKIEVHKQNIENEKNIDKSELLAQEMNKIDDKVIIENENIVKYGEIITSNNEIIDNELLLIKDTNSKLEKTKSEIESVKGKLNEFESKFKTFDNDSLKVKSDKDVVDTNISGLNENKKEILLTIQDIEINLKGTVECPNCHHEFIVGKEDIDVEEERLALNDAKGLLDKVESNISTLKGQLSEFDTKIVNLRRNRLLVETEENEVRRLIFNLNTSIDKFLSEIRNKESNINSIKIDNEKYKKLIENCKLNISELERLKSGLSVDSFDNSEKIKSIEDEIEKCVDEISDIELQSKAIDESILEYKQWAFTFKEFSQYLSVKTLKVLQGYANKFLNDLKTDLRIQLEGYKIKADGTLSDKITAYIVRDGNVREFGNFSGGERVRLEAAMILTIQHAINSTHPYGGLNFLSIDEIFESTDRLGINLLTSSLMELKKTILITTHIPGDNYDCPVVIVKKVNGISKLIS